MTDTFGTEIRIDHIDELTLRDRTIWTLGLTNITVNAFISDQKRHLLLQDVFKTVLSIEFHPHKIGHKGGNIPTQASDLTNQRR